MAKKRKVLCRRNEEFIERAKLCFSENLAKAELYHLKEVPKEQMCASNFTASRKADPKCQFFVESIDHDTTKQLQTKYVERLFHQAESRLRDENLEVLLTGLQVDMMKCFSTLEEFPDKEAEVRFAMADPLVRFFQEFNTKYKVCTSVLSSSLHHTNLTRAA